MSKMLTYLACPYSSDDPDVRRERFEAVNVAAGHLMQSGKLVFSPISHTHPIAEACGLPLGWDFWQAYDRAFIEASQDLVVLLISGWRESKGVSGEIAIARELGIPVMYLEMNRRQETFHWRTEGEVEVYYGDNRPALTKEPT
jgi:hypothetical protein